MQTGLPSVNIVDVNSIVVTVEQLLHVFLLRHRKSMSTSIHFALYGEILLKIALVRQQMDKLAWYEMDSVKMRSEVLRLLGKLLCPCLCFKVLPDYLKALLSVVPQGKPSEQHMQQIARLAALQHRAKDTIYLPTL